MDQSHASRRSFLKNVSFATAFFAVGGYQKISANTVFENRSKVVFRFVVASDAHYGQPGTAYDEMMEKITRQINSFHQESPLDFCVINGDIIHDKKHLLPLAKQKLDALDPVYYVTRGNHDMVTADYWNEVWGMPLNHTVIVKDQAIILGDTSNEAGKYLSPDLNWLAKQLEANKQKNNVFLFLHIPQKAWTANGINTPDFETLIDKYKNVTAIFHGHEHDQDGVKMLGERQTPCFFDAHMGGNWGTPYKGFRVVEVLNNDSWLSYMMNPTHKINEYSRQDFYKK
jgi:metallophosphoesterase superfamily enzyme